MVGLLRASLRLVVHDVSETSGLVLKKTNAFRVVEGVRFEELSLGPVVQPFVGDVDAELVEGIGAGSHVLGAGEIEEGEEEEGIERSRKLISVVGGTVRVEEDGTHFLLDELGLVGETSLKLALLDTEEVGDDPIDVRIPNDGRILVSVTVDGEFEVAKMEDRSKELAGLRYMTFRVAYRLERNLQLLKP
ncbi:hypothetical protein PQX77_022289 [Marasmius sp. AFHP31]|nr:hypothetical protein PQX77_022289 [Marasmius sp. AFHP31]